MSNQIADGYITNYIPYWLNQALITNGQYVVGNTTTYSLNFINPGAGSFSLIIFPMALNSSCLMTLRFVASGGVVGNSYTGYVVISYYRTTGNVIQADQFINQQYNPLPMQYSLIVTGSGSNITLGVFGPTGTNWKGTVEFLKSP